MTRVLRVELADPLGVTERLVCELGGVEVERVPAVDWRGLGRSEPDAVLVASDLGAGRSGVDLVHALARAGCPTSVLLLASAPDRTLEEQALAAGADAVVDLAHAEPWELGRLLRLAGSGRRGAEARYARLLDQLAAWLVYDGRNALAGIGCATRVVSDELPEDSPGRVLCEEIRLRVAQLRERIEAVALAARPAGCWRPGMREIPHFALVARRPFSEPAQGTGVACGRVHPPTGDRSTP